MLFLSPIQQHQSTEVSITGVARGGPGGLPPPPKGVEKITVCERKVPFPLDAFGVSISARRLSGPPTQIPGYAYSQYNAWASLHCIQ